MTNFIFFTSDLLISKLIVQDNILWTNGRLKTIFQSSGSAGSVVLDKQTEKVRKNSPLYKVLLHNDPVNSMEYVVQILRQVVPKLSEQDAISIMLQAHNTGIGLVIICDLEPAEFYSESLKSKGLTSTIEKEG